MGLKSFIVCPLAGLSSLVSYLRVRPGTTTFSIMTLSIKIFSIKTLSIKGLFATLSITTFSINDIQNK
jgi:hypothetical protein